MGLDMVAKFRCSDSSIRLVTPSGGVSGAQESQCVGEIGIRVEDQTLMTAGTERLCESAGHWNNRWPLRTGVG